MTNKLLLPPAGTHILVAVSGGADSMCLLHVLRARGYEVGAAHYEHGIRGEESLRDCAFVQRYCQENGIPFYCAHGDVPAYAAEHGLGLEEAARELRYDFLEETAEEEGYGKIATAHNADDNAETVLFHLVRGSGLAGLRGIPYERMGIIRPLLHVTREEIEQYLKEEQIPHVEDSTNGDETYSRNRIRRRVMPLLRELNPQMSAAIGRTSELVRRDDECLTRLAAEFLLNHMENGSLPTAALSALHPAIASRALRLFCPGGSGWEEKHVCAALALCSGTEYALLDLPGIRLRRERGRIYADAADPLPLPEREVPPEGELLLDETGRRLHCRFTEDKKEIHSMFKTSALRYENICGKLSCSSPRQGEKMRPVGRKCSKSIRDLLKEAGLSYAEREAFPVVRDERGAALLPGIAVDERLAAGDGARSIIITIYS